MHYLLTLLELILSRVNSRLRYLDEASCAVVLSNPGLIKKGQYVSWGPGLVASPYSASAQGFDILIKYSSPRCLATLGSVRKEIVVGWGQGLITSPYLLSNPGFDILMKYSTPILGAPRLDKEIPSYMLGTGVNC